MIWEPTHLLDDGSYIRFITDDEPATPGMSIVENEDGELFEVASTAIREEI